MRIIVDAREYDSLNPEAPAIYGASEPLVKRLVDTLHAAGHRVDAVWKGDEELFVDGVIWWPWNKHPSKCDVLISCEWLIHASEFTFDRLYVPLNKINPILDNHEREVDGFLCFTEEHKRQVLLYNSTVKPEQCIVLPVGVEPGLDIPKVRNRLIWCHSPERGLYHLARQWPYILKQVPDATLAITYGLERSWETNKWLMDSISEYLAECMAFVKANPDSVMSLGRTNKATTLRAQAEAELASYPCDAPLPGIVTSLAVMECAAAGCALILPKLEGLPEEFGDIAQMLDIPISEQEWVDATVTLLRDEQAKQRMAEAGREWARNRTWGAWAQRWVELIEGTGHADAAEETAQAAATA